MTESSGKATGVISLKWGPKMMRVSITKIRSATWSRAAIIALLMAMTTQAHAEDDSAKSVELRLEGACDANNSRLWVINNHATKAIVASLRWSLLNSKRVASDQFQVAPGSKLEVGCAAKADIVSVHYAE
jgi:hypothetical protein